MEVELRTGGSTASSGLNGSIGDGLSWLSNGWLGAGICYGLRSLGGTSLCGGLRGGNYESQSCECDMIDNNAYQVRPRWQLGRRRRLEEQL